MSIRPAAGRLVCSLFVRQCSILSTYHQYTVVLELRIFRRLCLQLYSRKKVHQWDSNPGPPTLPTLQSSALTVRPSCNTPDIGSYYVFKSIATVFNAIMKPKSIPNPNPNVQDVAKPTWAHPNVRDVAKPT